MGCNCKASQYVRNTKKMFGYAPETRKNINIKERLKMLMKIIAIWVITLCFIPIVIVGFICFKLITKKEHIRLMDIITIRM